jgi:RND family efflux transporter MFP subunit
MPTKTDKPNFIPRLFLVLLVLGGIAAATLFSFRPTVRVVAAYKDKSYEAVPGSVVVREEYPLDLMSEVEGFVDASVLDPGRKVNKDEIVAQLNTGALLLEIKQLKSEYAATQERFEIGSDVAIQLENAKFKLEAAKRRLRDGSLAQADFNEMERNFQGIQNRVKLEDVNNRQTLETFKNSIAGKEILLKKMTITAPFDGIVTAVFFRPGALLPAKTPIAKLITISRTVEAKISEENFQGIKLGQKATVRFTGGRENLDAKVIKILPTADPETQRYVIHLDVKIDPEQLVPGATGEVTVIIAERPDAILIPRRALKNKKSVFVAVDGRVQLRPVEVGYTDLILAEITKGVAVGEQVIVEDLDKLQDGDRVRIEGAAK